MLSPVWRVALEPPEPSTWAVGLLPAAAAAFVAVVASTLTSVSRARLSAVLENSSGSTQRALSRFLRSETFLRARWRVLRALGISASAALLLDSGASAWQAVLAVVGTYAVISQIGTAVLSRSSESVAPRLLSLMYPLELLVSPIADVLVILSRLLARPLKQSIPSPALAGTEVEMLVNEGEERGVLDHEQSEMIRNVLDFGDTEACELMVPRTQIQAIEVGTPAEDVLKVIVEQEHSRYPVYRDSIDNVVGILHVKDLFLFAASHDINEAKLGELLRQAVFVPETQLAASVLQELRTGRHHMALVLDEFGGVSGLLTLEDLLEEIVGEIEDEYDDEQPPIAQLSNGHFIVDASIPVADLNRQLGLELPDDEEYNSLGGYIVEEMGHVPEAGTELERAGHRFLIRMSDERRVAQVEIAPPALSATA